MGSMSELVDTDLERVMSAASPALRAALQRRLTQSDSRAADFNSFIAVDR
ncbi:hypothetical protein [Nocardia heshunensis]